jgi:hypothetical protein
MKKTFFALAMLLSFAVSNAQDLYQVNVKTKDGMGREVVVKVSVSQEGADFTVEQAARNRNEQLKTEGKGFETWEQSFEGAVRVACLFTEIFVVKNKATWVPSNVSLLWDPELGRYVGAVKGYAQNSYGVFGEVYDLVEMDLSGSISRQ